ncbi:SDR family oxidoreductase, partial [Methylobacterium sp. D54C]
LTLDMELEAGLGIDSIKRVQILSALQEKLPQLADVDTAALAALDTLGAIVALAGSGGIVASSSPSSAAPASLTPTLGRMIVAEEESAVPGLLTPGFAGVQSIWIIGGPADLAGMLAARLAETGLHARAVDTPPVDVRAAILLAGIAETSDADPIATTETVFRQVQACGHAMAAGGTLVIVQPGGEADAGWLAGAGAIAKTAALEWPNVVVRVIELSADVLAGESSAEAIHRELIGGGMQLEVTLAGDGRRLVPALRPEPAPTPATVAIPTDGVLLVSGGARGITAACLTELLAERPQKVAILGRTPLEDEPAELAGIVDDAALKRALLGRHQAAGITPSPQRIGAEVRAILAARELRTNLARLAATGATVRYDAVDIADADAALEAVARIRSEFGPISGLVHAAGVLADKEILLKTSDQFRTVMRTKVDGLRNLLDATRDDALTRLVCFSSIAAWRGNLGQSDYAAANQVLNRVCRAERKRRGEACLVKSIGWGPWAGGMVDAGLEALFVARGVPLIPLKEGARFFADEYLGRNGSAVEVVFGGGLAAFAAADLPRSRSFHARFHRSTHGYIDSHVVRSNRVVPMVAAIEVALRSVAHWLGGVARRAVDLEVVNGMVLSSFEGAGDVFEIGCTAPDGEGRVAVTITDPAGKLCYRMGIVPGEAPLANSEAERPSLDRWPAAKPIYDGRLFHGPALQVIETIEGLDEHGAAGLLRTRVPLAASASSAPIDILDGGIQLSTLWNHETRGRESLPTSAAAVYLAEGWDHAAPVRCEALLIAKTSLSSRWTLRYRDEAGTLLGLIEGLTMHDLPAAAA